MTASLAYDASYFKTISGILKICCLLCSFVGALCIFCSRVSWHNFRGIFYISVALFGFCCSTCVLFARLWQLWQRKFYHCDAVKWETYLHASLAVAFFVASAVSLSLDVPLYSVATFFGFLAFCFYVYDAYFGYRLSRQSDAATQTTQTTQTQNV